MRCQGKRKKDREKERRKERKKERKKERYQLSTSFKLYIQQIATIQSRQITALEFVYENFTLFTHTYI